MSYSDQIRREIIGKQLRREEIYAEAEKMSDDYEYHNSASHTSGLQARKMIASHKKTLDAAKGSSGIMRAEYDFIQEYKPVFNSTIDNFKARNQILREAKKMAAEYQKLGREIKILERQLEESQRRDFLRESNDRQEMEELKDLFNQLKNL